MRELLLAHEAHRERAGRGLQHVVRRVEHHSGGLQHLEHLVDAVGNRGRDHLAALDPRRSATCSTIMNAAPRKMPKASAVSTTHVESMASPLTSRNGCSARSVAGRPEVGRLAECSGSRHLLFTSAGRMCGAGSAVRPARPCAGTEQTRIRYMREVFQQELREVQDRLVEIAELVAISIEEGDGRSTSPT